MDERERVLWMGVRQVLIMALGLVEDYLALPRSIVPRRRRVGAASGHPRMLRNTNLRRMADDGLRANGGGADARTSPHPSPLPEGEGTRTE